MLANTRFLKNRRRKGHSKILWSEEKYGFLLTEVLLSAEETVFHSE